MKNKKVGIIIAGVLLGLATTSVLLYARMKKLLKYKIGVKYVRLKNVKIDKLTMDVGLNFTNNSDLEIVLSRQEYDIYLNGVFLTTLKSDKEQVIYPESISTLNIEVDADPKKMLQSIPNRLEVVTNLKEQNLRLDMRMWIKFGLFTIPITYSYENKIKNWA